MRDPEAALELARRRAAAEAEPAGGAAGGGDAAGDPAGEGILGPEAAGAAARLRRWAIIDPSEAEVRSTRPLGAPITFGKRLLVRLLRQHTGFIAAQQSRFNAAAAAHVERLEGHVARLEERVAELEREAAQRTAGGER